MSATLTRAAITAPATADEATRSVELVIATENPINGQVLTCTPAAVMTSAAPVPVLLSHDNHIEAMAGRLGPLRFEAGKVFARAYFTDAPAADQGWQLARSGCAVSVGASFGDADIQQRGTTEVVKRWRLVEASLVPAGKDPAALTRSLPSITQTVSMESAATQAIPADNDQNTETADLGLSRSEANRQLEIQRSATIAGLTADETELIIQETAGQPVAAGLMQVIKRHAAVVEGRAGAAGHPARVSTGGAEPVGLEATLTRAIKGERLEQPLWLTLRAAGIGHGHDAHEVWRSALTGGDRWLARSLSTSDLPQLLTSTGNRRLIERFSVAEAGVRVAANVRRLTDYRAASVVDVGLVGSATEIKEGGEIKFAAVDEAATSYKPKRIGLGLSFTPESLANDDLQGLDAALAELADACLDAEALALVDLLEGVATGRTSVDGKALFHADHANSVTSGPLSITTIGSAVALLRNQKAISGRYISQEPAQLLVATSQETLARQLLSTAINAAQSSAVNPWSNLQIAVDPRLSGSWSYIIGNSRRPLELGRLTEAPVMTAETKFETGAYRTKVEHAYGATVQDHRAIIRVASA